MKSESVGEATFEALGTMLDRLLDVDLDCPHGNSETFGDFAIGHTFDARKDQHAASALGKLRDRASEQVDLGAVFQHPCGVGAVIRNIEEAIDLVDCEAAALGPSAVVGNVECDTKQISLCTPHWPDLTDSFEAEICFLQHVGGKVR
jgi:hypothetical protein